MSFAFSSNGRENSLFGEADLVIEVQSGPVAADEFLGVLIAQRRIGVVEVNQPTGFTEDTNILLGTLDGSQLAAASRHPAVPLETVDIHRLLEFDL